MSRYPIADAGFQLHDIRLTIKGASATEATSAESRRRDYSVSLLAHGIVEIDGVPPRGELSVVKVIQKSGSATGFRVVILDRAQEGLWDENIVFDSSQIASVATEYPDGYGAYAAQTVRRLHQYAIGIPFQSSSVQGEGIGMETKSIFIRVIPNSGADNEFDVSVKLYALG